MNTDIKDFYEQLIKVFKKEEIKLIVTPAEAFKFYDAYNAGKLPNYGIKLRKENWLIGVIDIIAHISLLAGIIVCIFVLKWYSAIVIPIIFVIGITIFAVRSFVATSIVSVVSAILSIILLILWKTSSQMAVIFIMLLPLPYLLRLLDYLLATTFLRNNLLRNKENYNKYMRYKSIMKDEK